MKARQSLESADSTSSNEDTSIQTQCNHSSIIASQQPTACVSEAQTLRDHGYKRGSDITTTLQGEVFLANRIEDNQLVVVKRACKTLHQRSLGRAGDGSLLKVSENIFRESVVLKSFVSHHPPASCIRFHDFFWNQESLFLVMEKGGQGLFEFTVDCHQRILDGKLSIKSWRRAVGRIFTDMVECISWMHGSMRCCHLDVSLENVVLGNDTFFDEKEGCVKEIEAKFIDFGLAKTFSEECDFECTDFVGKAGYQSPQSFLRKPYKANKADVWSLGVSLFMLVIGAPPFTRPSVSNAAFVALRKGHLKQLLRLWDRLRYITPKLFDLLTRMLCYDEEERISVDEIMAHPWMKQFVTAKQCSNKT